MQLETIAIVLIMFTLKKCRAQIDNQEVISVTALLGGSARLPCRVAPEVYGNHITVLTWYNTDKSTKAIYSRDYRGETRTPTTSRTDRRYTFSQPDAGTAYLLIEPVVAEDAGRYRCHVDFVSSRSRDTHFQLNITVSPQEQDMVLLYGNGTVLTGDGDGETAAGPYREGDDAVLICVVIGGDPPPNVTWWRGTELVDDTWSRFSSRRVRNELKLGKLERHHNGQQYTCQAANNYISPPISNTVSILMYLKPTSVLLYASQEPVRAGPFEMQCRILGAHPTPTVIWMVGDEQRQPEQSIHHVADDFSGRGDMSTVTIPITAHDNGLDVTCCTEKHTWKPEFMCSDPHTLNIYYSPVVQLTVNKRVVNETAALLGSSLTLVCDINANPPITDFIWVFNEAAIKSGVCAGAEGSDPCASASALTLNVTMEAGGVYWCSATNNEGIGQSQHLKLDVQYPPRCINSGWTEYSVGSSDAVNMTCEVSGNPAPDSYRWHYINRTLNTDQPDQPLPGAAAAACCTQLDITEDNTLEYRISKQFGYGTVLCWGQNDFSNESSSELEDACYFIITDLSIPHRPTDCKLVRRHDRDISVSCVKGHDGGLQQKFTLTLLSGSGDVLLRVIALEPQLTTREPADNDYSIQIVAHNDKGVTEPIILTANDVTEDDGEVQRGVVADVGTLLLSLGGGVGVVVLVACALVMGARELRSDTGSDGAPKARSLRRRTSTACPYATDESNCDTCHDSEGGSESSFHGTESFGRAVSVKSESRRGGSFRAPRCIADGSPLLRHNNSCRLHSLQNICTTLNRRREGEALCDHLLLHLPVDLPNYSIPKTPVPFYTMPRKNHLRVKPQDTDPVQNLDNLPLPPPPEEFHTFRSATDILNKECPSNNYMNVPSKADNAYNNVIISPMNTVGLPSSTSTTAGSALYAYAEDKPQRTDVTTPASRSSRAGSQSRSHDTAARF